MQLPNDLDQKFWHNVEVYEEAHHMDDVIGIERRAIKQGYQQDV